MGAWSPRGLRPWSLLHPLSVRPCRGPSSTHRPSSLRYHSPLSRPTLPEYYLLQGLLRQLGPPQEHPQHPRALSSSSVFPAGAGACAGGMEANLLGTDASAAAHLHGSILSPPLGPQALVPFRSFHGTAHDSAHGAEDSRLDARLHASRGGERGGGGGGGGGGGWVHGGAASHGATWQLPLPLPPGPKAAGSIRLAGLTGDGGDGGGGPGYLASSFALHGAPQFDAQAHAAGEHPFERQSPIGAGVHCAHLCPCRHCAPCCAHTALARSV